MLLFETITDIPTSSVQNSHAQWLIPGQMMPAVLKGRKSLLCICFVPVVEATASVPCGPSRYLNSLSSIFV